MRMRRAVRGRNILGRATNARPGSGIGKQARQLALEIAPEHLDEVFRPFFSTTGSAGTGLGLNSVAEIARRHVGAVGVESALGAGSTFTLCLPVDRASTVRGIHGEAGYWAR